MIKGIITVIVGFIILMAIIGIVGGNKEGDKVKETGITLSQAEKVCQDANFLQNYLDINDTKVLTIKYKPVFIDQEDGTKYLSWYGEQRSTKTVIAFECVVHEVEGKVAVKSLTIDGVEVYNK